MKTSKKILIVFLLVVLTCSVVFLPQFLSGQKEKNALGTVTKRTYNALDITEVTSAQIAKLYYNNGIVSNQSGDISEVSVVELMDMLFADDEVIYKPMKAIIENGELLYARENKLVNIDDKPTALSFVACYIDSPYGNCDITFEEKTNTLIGMSFTFNMDDFGYLGSADDYINQIQMIITDYYEKQLGMGGDEYYFNFIHPSETVNRSFFDINCGLKLAS